MAKPLSSWTLVALLLAAPVLGCAARPPEKPIVLRPVRPERRVTIRTAPKRAPVQAASGAPALAEPVGIGELPPPEQMPAAKPAPDATMSPADKEALFRDFDRYLSRPGQTP